MKKIITLYYVAVLLLQPLPVLAEEAQTTEIIVNTSQDANLIAGESQPIAVSSEQLVPIENYQKSQDAVLPTPIPSPTPAPQEVSDQATPTSFPSQELVSLTNSNNLTNPTPQPEVTVNEAADLATFVSTPSSAVTPSPLPTVSSLSLPTSISSPSASTTVTTTTNTGVIENTLSHSSNTGTNTVTSSTTATTTTGDAYSQQTVVTEINTSLIGSQGSYSVINVTSPDQKIELPLSNQLCTSQTSGMYSPVNTNHSVNNNAIITNNLSLEASTGSNEVSANNVSIETGNANLEANVVNLANTTLIGNCWTYGILNFFTPFSNAVILPNEQELHNGLQPTSSTSFSSSFSSNQATVSSTVETQATTGSNQSTGVQDVITGNTTTEIDEVTAANTIMLGDNWGIIKITNPHYWHGTLTNGMGQSYLVGNDLYYLLPGTPSLFAFLSSSTQTQSSTTQVNNSAGVTNNLSLKANTGQNIAHAETGSLKTGEANISVAILNLLNTTIIGDRWYYFALHLFDDFKGSITFARPDLALDGPHMISAKPGESINLTMWVTNIGTSSGRDLTFQTTVPNGWQTLNPNGNLISLLNANKAILLPITVTIPTSTNTGEYLLSLSVQNSLTEQSLTNNSITIPVRITIPATTQSLHSPANNLVSELTPPITNTLSTQSMVSTPQKQRRKVKTSGIPPTQPQLTKRQPVLATSVQALDNTPHSLRISLPGPLAGAFCSKYWELCSVGGILITSTPLKAWERKKLKATTLQPTATL